MSDSPEKERSLPVPVSNALTVAFLVGLYLLGALHWCAFFNVQVRSPWGPEGVTGMLHWGELKLEAYDWPKETAYLDMQRHMLLTGELPWQVDYSFHGTDRFLALPETNLLPHFLLLPWLDNRAFLLVNILVLYTGGFLGCLWIRSRYRLGPVSFAFLAILMNANGYVVAHLSVGHNMWGGCFFLPYFALFLMEWSEDGPSLRLSLRVAFVIFAMMLQGAFHLANWCWIFFLLFLLCRSDWWWHGFLTLLFGGLLSVCRIVPAAVAFWGPKAYTFTSGYPTAVDLITGLVVLRDHTADFAGNFVQLGWWEYDAYIGLVAFGALIYFGIWLRVRPTPDLEPYRFEPFDVPLIAQTILSIGPIYAAIAALPIPLANAERVSSRFIIVPLIVLVAISAVRMQRVLERARVSTGVAALFAGLLIETAVSLGWHNYRWRVSSHDKDPFIIFNAIELTVVGEPEWWYVLTVFGSAAVSLIAFVVAVVLYSSSGKVPDTSPER